MTDRLQRIEYSSERLLVVDVRRSMKRQHSVGSFSESEFGFDSRLPGTFEVLNTANRSLHFRRTEFVRAGMPSASKF